MEFAKLRAVVVAAIACLALGLAGPATAQAQVVKWEDVVGLILQVATPPNNNPVGSGTGTVNSGANPWTTRGGEAVVNLRNGHVEFSVRGLVLAGGNAIGTPDGVTLVKGTLVCDTNGSAGGGNSTIVDTELVPLSPQGDAQFSGFVVLPLACFEPDIAFLIRIQAGPWIANGAVRTP
jgi:hypothetical protein